MRLNRKFGIVVALVLTATLWIPTASAQLKMQNKVELEDVEIRGEANGNNGLRLLSRARNTLDGRILMRKSFRERSLEELPKSYSSKNLSAQTSP